MQRPRGGPLGTEYQYEEDLTLSLDGSATLVVNASVPALVALRGLPLNTDLRTRGDELKNQLRDLYASDVTRVGRISNWTRRGRRFVGIHVTVSDVRALSKVAPFAWAKYDLREEGEQVVFRHTLSKPRDAAAAYRPDRRRDRRVPPASSRAHPLPELALPRPRRVAPRRARQHPDLGAAAERSPRREADRLRGGRTPDVMEVRMDRQSILYRTLWLFGIAFAAALLVIAGLIWLTMRRGATTDPSGPASSSHPH